MKSTILLAGLASTALAQNSTFTTSTSAQPSTIIVSVLTTVCGAATVLTRNGNSYTCTEAMTLTITDCPCTMTHATIAPATHNAIFTSNASPTSTVTISVAGTCPASVATQKHALGTGTAIMPSSTQGLTHQLTNGALSSVVASKAGVALVAFTTFFVL